MVQSSKCPHNSSNTSGTRLGASREKQRGQENIERLGDELGNGADMENRVGERRRALYLYLFLGRIHPFPHP